MKPKKRKDNPLEPLETLKWLLLAVDKFANPVVGDYLNPDWTLKWNWKVGQVFVLSVFTAFCYICDGYQNRNDMAEFVFSACLIMIDVLGLQRIIKWVTNHEEMMEIQEHLLVFTKRWEQVPEAFVVLVWYYRLLYRVTVAILVVLVGSLTSLSAAPFLYYVIFGKMQLFVQCFIPGIDYMTHPGFEIHAIFHAWCCFCIMAGIGATTAFVLLMLVQNCMEADVLRARLRVLMTLIHNTDKNSKELTDLLKGIFKAHQCLNEFLVYCEDILSVQNMSDHVVVGVQVCLGLFICMQEFWLSGYFLITCGFVVIFSLDLLGTIIEVKFEKLSMDVYDIPWYLMSVPNQRMYLYFLGNTQKTSRLTLVGHVPLSLNTFVRFYKGIYSYLMILREIQT